MKLYDQYAGAEIKPLAPFRVVYGDQWEKAKKTLGPEQIQPSLHLNAEAEEFWAGRFPAARLSTRIAA